MLWKNLNLLFRRRQWANRFIKELAEHDVFEMECRHVYGPVAEFSAVGNSQKDHAYPFDHMILLIRHKLTWTEIQLDVAVASYFPCNDFDVNRLTWNGKVLSGYRDETNIYRPAELDEIRARVVAGEARMLDIFPDFSRHMHKDYAAARVRSLMACGFRVDAPAEFLPTPVSMPLAEGQTA